MTTPWTPAPWTPAPWYDAYDGYNSTHRIAAQTTSDVLANPANLALAVLAPEMADAILAWYDCDYHEEDQVNNTLSDLAEKLRMIVNKTNPKETQ
jgi:hypothetical protein